jgi:hypothetical protein
MPGRVAAGVTSAVAKVNPITQPISFTAAGNCVIDANQAGNDNYTTAPQVPFTGGANAQRVRPTS